VADLGRWAEKMKLIDALLGSSAGPEIRKVLRLSSESVFTELLYVRLRRVAERSSLCDIRACIAKIEGGELAQDAIEVVVRCSEVTALDWHSSFFEEKERPKIQPASSEIEIDTEDCFRILCGRVDVVSVQIEKLGVILEEKKPNQPPEPTAPSGRGSS
jgi:hypothetical protein